jgi:hypothetical protein
VKKTGRLYTSLADAAGAKPGDGADRTPWWRVQLEEYMSERVTNAGAS